jgi:hypothetical protein
MSNENLKLWDQVETTDPAFTKEVKLGKYKFTDIDAMWSIKRATELWGPYGTQWGLRLLEYEVVYNDNTPAWIILQGVFYYPHRTEGFPIIVDMPYDAKGEVFKKLQTTAIGKSLSRLGFSADVYLGKFEDSKYVAAMNEKYGNTTGKTKAGKKGTQYPDPDPAASGILGALAQEYMAELQEREDDTAGGYVVDFKKVCHAVWDVFGKYPTKLESVPVLKEAVPLEAVLVKNDFRDGVD